MTSDTFFNNKLILRKFNQIFYETKSYLFFTSWIVFPEEVPVV